MVMLIYVRFMIKILHWGNTFFNDFNINLKGNNVSEFSYRTHKAPYWIQTHCNVIESHTEIKIPVL